MKFWVAICSLFYVAMLGAQESPLSRYVTQNYDVLYKSALVNDPADADYILLAVQHDQLGHLHLYSELINRFASKDSIIFVEGVPSWTAVKPTDSQATVWIQAPVKIKGWDADWMNELLGVDLTEVNKLQVEMLKVHFAIVWSKRDDLKADYRRLMLALRSLQPKIQAVLGESMGVRIRETFPARVYALNSTLKRSVGKAPKVFVIAGFYHLWDVPANPFYQLAKEGFEEYYQFCKTHKAVTLLPKQDIADYWKTYYESYLKE